MAEPSWQEALMAGMVEPEPIPEELQPDPVMPDEWPPPAWVESATDNPMADTRLAPAVPIDDPEAMIDARPYVPGAEHDTSAITDALPGLAESGDGGPVQLLGDETTSSNEAAFNAKFGLNDVIAAEGDQGAVTETPLPVEAPPAPKDIQGTPEESLYNKTATQDLGLRARDAERARLAAEKVEYLDKKRVIREQESAKHRLQMEELRMRSRAVQEKGIDSKRLWNNLANTKKAAIIIGAALDGWINPGGRNGAIETLGAMIDRDIAEQKENLDRETMGIQMDRQYISDMRDISNDEHEEALAEKVMRWSAIESGIMQKYAWAERGGTVDQNAQAMADAARIQREKAEQELQLKKDQLAEQVASRRARSAEAKADREARATEADKQRQWQTEESYKKYMRDLGMGMFKAVTGGKGDDAKVGARSLTRKVVVEGREIEVPRSEVVVNPLGNKANEVIGVFTNPDDEVGNREFKKFNAEHARLVEELNELIAEGKLYDKTYTGIGQNIVASEGERAYKARFQGVLTKLVHTYSGVSAKESERQNIAEAYGNIRGLLESDPARARVMARDQVIKDYTAMANQFMTPVLEEDGTPSYMRGLLPPEMSGVDPRSAAESLRVAAQPPAPATTDIKAATRARVLAIKEAVAATDDPIEAYQGLRKVELLIKDNVARLPEGSRSSEKEVLGEVRKWREKVGKNINHMVLPAVDAAFEKSMRGE